MNQQVSHSVLTPIQALDRDDDAVDLGSYLSLLSDNRWLIAGTALVMTLLGTAFALISKPIYEANILVQSEDGAGASGRLLGELADAFKMSSPATAEIEILRSRSVVTRAVIAAQLDVSVKPKRFPILGHWSANGSAEVSDPGIFGVGGYTWGAEHASVTSFSVPGRYLGVSFTLTVTKDNHYVLAEDESGIRAEGRVGTPLVVNTEAGQIQLNVAELRAKEGAQFVIERAPLLETVERLQKNLVIAERGKPSGIIGVSLEGEDPARTAAVLNEIGREYIRRNVERKTEEAEQSLAFLERELPEMKLNLEKAEARYNAMRNNRGTVDLGEEARSALQRSSLSQTRLIELKQRRDELLTRYQPSNPLVQAVDQQILTLNRELAALTDRIKSMPELEQDVQRLTRDIKVKTDLYSALLNSAQQLRVVKASKVGNIRLLDEAVVPVKPIRPKRLLVVALSLSAGIGLGVVIAFVRRALYGGIEDPHEIERMLGLTISAAIPYSTKAEALSSGVNSVEARISVLAQAAPTDPAVESLRSLRTSLHFSMVGAKNKIVMMTGPTPGVGKSFVSVNFAAVLASTRKKVLLIDGDLRKGHLQRYFGVNRERGLSEVIAGEFSFDEVVHKNVIESLDFLTTGALPSRPAELLEHPNFAALLTHAAAHYDIVLIDTAPVLVVTDALIVAPHVGMIFSIVRGGMSSIGEIQESTKRLNQAGQKLAGVVFNYVKQRQGGQWLNSGHARYRYTQYEY